MEKEDPYSAIGHYQTAIEFDDDAYIHFKLSTAYLKIADYTNALFQSEKTRKDRKFVDLRNQATYRSAELLKRNGRYYEAIELLNVFEYMIYVISNASEDEIFAKNN